MYGNWHLGDTLLRAASGQTDLPGGDHETLLNAIRTELFPLDDDFIVFPDTAGARIGVERRTNPFLVSPSQSSQTINAPITSH